MCEKMRNMSQTTRHSNNADNNSDNSDKNNNKSSNKNTNATVDGPSRLPTADCRQTTLALQVAIRAAELTVAMLRAATTAEVRFKFT